ncbi:MAG: nitrogenase cofactor biosynthesis protein NifB [Clostridia bacterium]|nr:nitrogenase cofactor biosynthesis protein NifB [Clostridia bacterium]
MQNRNFVNLNINPCKMCMPLGAVLAFKGVKNSMMLLHGSQGCSTYIRRHMAGHYNEPIDIASSSLTEQGTVYGGESNLKKGLKNIIALYNPEIIGVATTCLAETIGEDISRFIDEFIQEENIQGLKIIPVSTPGYGGTQYEGYYAALVSILKGLPLNSEKNNKINLITSNLSPGDIRNIKSILESFGVEYILYPDTSETLDAPYKETYKKIPDGGTSLEELQKMAGAKATIEFSLTVPDNLSPGQYLQEQYGVPLYRCGIPMGMDYTDVFTEILSKISGISVPSKIQAERGRLLDGMIDSHKHNAEGRTVIYGEPEMTLAVSTLCLENGIKPVLVATGAQNDKMKEILEATLETLYPNLAGSDKPKIMDDIDFQTIQKLAVELKANLLIGNSDGKVITEKEGIPLVRIGFPIHDRVGGQRLVYTGYNGTLKLMDDITNTLLENKLEKYRSSMFTKYYEEPSKAQVAETKEVEAGKSLEEKTKSHPCFGGGCGNARMHIPVAPGCNISCNYCNRKFDCVNESRPGVTSEVLSPEEAAAKFIAVRNKIKNLTVVGIAGPGDALANFENTKKSIELIRELDPDITFCLSTNGLMLPEYAEELVRLGVTHFTVTINTVDPEIGAKIYKEVTYHGKKYRGREAAEILLANQLEGLRILSSKNIICKVNIVMIKGVNDGHIEEVVKKVKDYGVFMTNIMPLIPAQGSVFEDMPLTSNKELNEMRKKCGIELKQMYHCKQCRADAIGTLENDCSSEFRTKACGGSREEVPLKEKVSYTFAVASKSGMMIDAHFGHVQEFYIYRYQDGEVRYVEKRSVEKYCTGPSDCDDKESKIDRLIKVIEDCNAVLAMRIGYSPSKTLVEKGVKVIQICGGIEEGIRTAAKNLGLEEKILERVV